MKNLPGLPTRIPGAIRFQFLEYIENARYDNMWLCSLVGEKYLIEEANSLLPEVSKTKGIIVYDTSYKNTKIIAETIAETLKESGIEVDLFYVKDVKNLSAKDYNFLVVGSPTRFGTMSFTIRGFLGKVKSDEWMNKPFAAFDTENPENIEKKEGSAAKKIAEKLKDKKMIQLSSVLKAVVLGQKGPLVEGEIERTKEHAKTLAIRLKRALRGPLIWNANSSASGDSRNDPC